MVPWLLIHILISLTGALQYLTFMGLDIAQAVQQICLYMLDLREPPPHVYQANSMVYSWCSQLGSWSIQDFSG
jgi:hypothetical protein